ncbi:MAG: type I secretion system permease/ATPase [Desulfonatronovibrio sp.]
MRKYLYQWKSYFLFAGLFSLFINLLYLTFPIYMLAIYDRVLSSHSTATLVSLTVAALMAMVVFGLLELLRSRLLVRASVVMDETIGHRILREMTIDEASINKTGFKEGLKDLGTLRGYFTGNAVFSLFDLPWTPIYLLVIYFMHPMLGLFALAGAVIILILGITQEILTRQKLGIAETISAKAGNFVATSLRNSETIMAMGMNKGMINTWKNMHDEAMSLETDAGFRQNALQSAGRAFRMAMQVMIFGLGAYYVLQNEATGGIIIAASILMGRALAPVDQAMSTWQQTIKARSAYKRLDRIFEKAASRQAQSMDLPAPKGLIEVEGATLGIDSRPVLSGITFTLNPGETMGLIGPSGAGKSTLCRLILGIWPSMGGKVRLDGVDVYSWDQEDLGPNIGYLAQEVELFEGSISENIARMGEVEPEKVIAAARMAGAHELILRLPLGYDTQAGEMGRSLSGGQRQRVGLARALYGNPRLVILDEPNSNLDDAGEKALMQCLQTLKKNQVTTIIVTHKPGILAGADKILVLKEGRVSMFGPRQEVFRKLSGK